jgi:hypothetical protein
LISEAVSLIVDATIRSLVLLVAFLVPASAGAVSAQERPAVAIRVAVSEMANLTYQLDCLAGLAHGSTPAYRELWTKELGWTTADDAALDRWRAARSPYSRPVPIVDTPSDGISYPDDLFAGGELDLGRRVRIAGLRARDTAGYASDIALLTLPVHAETLSATVEHFRPRFAAWWERVARPQLATFSEGLSRTIAKHQLDRFTASVARLYGIDPGARLAIEIHLVARPRFAGSSSYGEQVENYALVEVLDGERPEDRVDVVLHELFHYLYGRMPEARKLAIRRAFAASPDPASLATFNLFDEAIATALGNGLVLRAVKGEEALRAAMAQQGALYNDPFVERVAKRLLTPVAERLEKGSALDEPFVASYISEAGAALGPDRFSPLLALKMYSLAFESHELRSLHGPFANGVRPRLAGAAVGFGPEAREMFYSHAELSGAIFVTPAGLDGLKAWGPILGDGTLDRVRDLAGRHAAFVYGVRRGPRASIYLFVGRDAAALAPVVDEFARNHEPFAGLKFARP